jgi:glycine cleavage system transcriptional repressor
LRRAFALKNQIVISVLSLDRPGIVADITGVIYSLNGDLADLSQSVLSGFFIMTVIAQFKNDISPDKIKEEIGLIKSSTSLEVLIKKVDGTVVNTLPILSENIYIVTGQGENRTGLVFSIGTFCKDNEINIIDYDTRLSDNVYSMILEIDLTNSKSAEIIFEKLNNMANKLNFKVGMQHKSLFDTLNEISLY